MAELCHITSFSYRTTTWEQNSPDYSNCSEKIKVVVNSAM